MIIDLHNIILKKKTAMSHPKIPTIFLQTDRIKDNYQSIIGQITFFFRIGLHMWIIMWTTIILCTIYFITIIIWLDQSLLEE